MRIFLDANIYVSALLKPASLGTPTRIVNLALDRTFDVIVCEPLLAEIRRVVTERSYIRSRVSDELMEELLTTLRKIGIAVELPETLGAGRLRDPNDEYVLEASLLGAADYLVSSDRDVLAARDMLMPLRIVAAREFLAILDSE